MPEAEQLFEELREMSGDGPGVTRAAYMPSESAALDFVERVAEKYQLQQRVMLQPIWSFHFQGKTSLYLLYL